MIASTGPKISSWAIVIPGVTSENTVGLHEVAARLALRRLVAARDQLRALVHALLDVAAHALALRVRHQRPEVRALVERVAHHEVASATALAITSTSGSRSRGTSMRVSALQV